MDIEKEYLVDNVLSEKIYRIFQYIQDTIKENGDISQFKEDVLYVIHFLLERQLEPKQLIATEMVVKQREYMLFKEQRKKDEEHIRILKCELDKLNGIINLMAEQLTTPVHSKKWVIDYFTNKYEEGKDNEKYI